MNAVSFASFLMRCSAKGVALVAALLALGATQAAAEQVHVAVTANFTGAAEEIGRAFAEATGHTAVYSFGATGQLYAQISQGAPFAVFLAADQERPRKAVDEGLAEADSLFTYATGRIVLFSTDADLVMGPETLSSGAFEKIAIANPETAPYGAAAVETMTALGVLGDLESRLVRGENISQTYQFVATHNAELGFVALSQVIGRDDGSRWVVPQELHAPLAQDAVLLATGAGNPAAVAYLAFLKGPEGRAIVARFGYGTGD